MDVSPDGRALVGFFSHRTNTRVRRGEVDKEVSWFDSTIPWQLTNLARHLVLGSNKVETLCRHCGLMLHEPDASHCKACGNLIYQEYEGDD